MSAVDASAIFNDDLPLALHRVSRGPSSSLRIDYDREEEL